MNRLVRALLLLLSLSLAAAAHPKTWWGTCSATEAMVAGPLVERGTQPSATIRTPYSEAGR